MGSAFSSFQERRKTRVELKRKHKLYGSMSASKRKEVMRFKTRMEQQIEALNKQIASEKRALSLARANNLRKSVWSLQDQEPTKKPLAGKDFQDGQFHLSEYHRLLLEACQFAKYTSEHPLEKWTVCSLPNLYKSSVEKCQPRRWEFKTPSLS
ncbi:uncharacterized protein [Porites lutea]|uniref:uncharacterized protein n=1 Tax=Porites lutea TaxID=51062 RepID=UPI003CC54696